MLNVIGVDSQVPVGDSNVETSKNNGKESEYAIKQLVRALFKNEDDGFQYTPAHAVAKAICNIGDVFSDEVKHYISAQAAVRKWREGLSEDYRQIAIGGVKTGFGVGNKPNRYFGVPDDMVVPQLATDIAYGCTTFLKFFDTQDGNPKKRKEMPVMVQVDSSDKKYGVAWSIITRHQQYGGNYTRVLYPIEAFENGRAFLFAMVYWLYSGQIWETDIGARIDVCHDWTTEIFGHLNGNVEVVNLKLAEQK